MNLVKRRISSEVLISVTAPAFNEELNLRLFCERLKKNLDPITVNYEIIIVENGSTDDSYALLRELSREDSRVKYVQLSRNFGSQGGLIAGMTHSTGDVVITMDADLQHPPEVIPRLIDCWCEGFDIVGTRKKSVEYTGRIRRWTSRLFYRVMSDVTGLSLSDQQSDFRLLDRVALDAILALPEKDKFLRGLSNWVGFRQTSIDYVPEVRKFGYTKFGFLSLIAFALHGLVSFTALPLRIFSFVGLLVSLFALLNALYLLCIWLFDIGSEPPSGWLTLGTGIYFLGGLQLLGIGMLGEYLAQNLIESRRRPNFIVLESTAGNKTTISAEK